LIAAIFLGVAAIAAPLLIPAGVGHTHDALALKLREACAAQAVLVALLLIRKPYVLAPVCAISSLLAVHGLLAVAPRELLHGPFPLATQLEQEAGPSAGRWRVLTTGNDLFPMPAIDPRLAMTFGGTRSLLPNYNALAHIEGVVPYTALPDLDYERAWFAAPRAMSSLFGVAFVLRAPSASAPPGYTTGPHGILEKRFPDQPRAFLLPCARVEPDAAALANELQKPGFDPHRSAFVRAPIDLPEACASPPIALRIDRPKPELQRISATAAAPSLLVIAEHFEQGWHATIDGAAAEVVQVDLAAQGVRIPQGAHQIELSFHAPYLSVGLTMAIACFLLLAALELRRGARPPKLK
jgi:hypothetical protein